MIIWNILRDLLQPTPAEWGGRTKLCEQMETNCLKRYFGQTLEVNEDVADRNQGGLTG
jgi:hypothetical protein